MFRKSRIKIVVLIMASLVVFLALTLGVIYVSSRLSADAKNEQMLRRFAGREKEELTVAPDGDRDGEPPEGVPPDGGLPDGAPGRDRRGEPDDELFGASTFYTVEFDSSGEVVSVDSGRNDRIEEDELVAAARAADGKIPVHRRASGRRDVRRVHRQFGDGRQSDDASEIRTDRRRRRARFDFRAGAVPLLADHKTA